MNKDEICDVKIKNVERHKDIEKQDKPVKIMIIMFIHYNSGVIPI